jgi:hypothetical protein
MSHIAHVADFIVIPRTDTADPDRGFEVRVGEGESFPFSLPEGLVRDERAILAFMVNPNADVKNITFEVQINDHRLRTSTISGGPSRTFIEVVGRDVLRDGDANSIEFRVTSGTGVDDSSWASFSTPIAAFSDVVLWFQRKVTAAHEN